MASLTIPNNIISKLQPLAEQKNISTEQLAEYALKVYISAFSAWKIDFSLLDKKDKIRIAVTREDEVIYGYWPGKRYTHAGSRMSIEISGEGVISKQLLPTWIEHFPLDEFFARNRYPMVITAGMGTKIEFRANLGVEPPEARDYLRSCATLVQELSVLSLADLPSQVLPGMGLLHKLHAYEPESGPPFVVYTDQNGREFQLPFSQKAREQSPYFPRQS